MLNAIFDIRYYEKSQRTQSEKSLAIFKISVTSVPSLFSESQSKLMF